MLDEDIRAALGPLVQGFVYPNRRPQKDESYMPEELPVIVYSIIAEDWQTALTLCGPGLSMTRVQFDVYARYYRECRNLAYAAADILDNIDGWRINMEPFADDDERINRWLLEYEFGRNDAPDPYVPHSKVNRKKGV